MLSDLRGRLAAKQLELAVTDKAKTAIIDGGYDPIYGARPLKRYIQAHVETMIAKEIIAGSHAPADTLTVDADENRPPVPALTARPCADLHSPARICAAPCELARPRAEKLNIQKRPAPPVLEGAGLILFVCTPSGVAPGIKRDM